MYFCWVGFSVLSEGKGTGHWCVVSLAPCASWLAGLLDEPQPDHFPLHASFGELQAQPERASMREAPNAGTLEQTPVLKEMLRK